MTFGHLTAGLPGLTRLRRPDTPVAGVSTDSRRIQPGFLFVCIPGYQTDGHLFIPHALRAGAAAVVYADEAAAAQLPSEVASARVGDPRLAAALLSARFWGDPSRDLVLCGCTGTNGKTSTTFMLDAILTAVGFRSAVIGTLGRVQGGERAELGRTTPESDELAALLAQLRQENVTHVTMEVSSHALALKRTAGLSFDVTCFTNLTQDHFDFHGSLDDYLETKLLLFTEYAERGRAQKEMVAAVNLDDPYGRVIRDRAACRVLTYGLDAAADVRGSDVQARPEGVSLRVRTPSGEMLLALQIGGLFSAYNALAATTCALALGLDLGPIEQGLRQLKGVPGRFEKVTEDQDFTVVVDYAHSPDGLRSLLVSARALNPRRLLCVFGCGGDRDTDKRPRMGGLATGLADHCVITSDNPRSEQPEAIIEQIVRGATRANYEIEPDRREAIFRAVAACQPGDLLVIAGKGHETYQIFKDLTVDFDDRVVAREALAARGH